MIPNAFQIQKGRMYSKKWGDHSITLRYTRGLYLVSYGRDSWGFASYTDSVQKVLELMDAVGGTHNVRRGEGNTVRRLQGFENSYGRRYEEETG